MTGQRILMYGMARSGVAAARLFAERGATVRIADQKTAEQLGEALAQLRGLPGVEWRLGEPAESLLDGVDLMVISPGVPIEHPAVQKAKELGIAVLGELEMSYRLSQGTVIAITGTNGKTTTTTLVGEIFKNAGRRAHVVGNIGYPYASVAADTRPEDVVVVEVSSFQLETIENFHPAISAILNITEDHLNRHGTMARYAALKARVFENQQADDIVVLNWDDRALRAMRDQVMCKVAWFSRREVPPGKGAYLAGDQIVFGAPGKERAICRADEVLIPGPHNLENALAASAIAMAAGVPAPVIRHTLRTFKGVEHRIEFVRELGGVRFINDSKGTNADSTTKAIETMNRPTVIILGGYDKHVDFESMCKAIVDSPWIRHAVLIGDTAGQLRRQLAEAGYCQYVEAGYDFESAIVKAFALAEQGGNVLLSPACASFDMFKSAEHRGDEFKRIVNALPGRAG
ncbi:MAG: UDP-N-acetylmuramoyl-L-alanine--D-glutamate ligase [Clostridiales bacterium]|nr:UDP-N-acetylmuramoyl-L-alanine--D-glutamate ligase [Clostridiales bacterium]